jgi:hypothetical protein
LEELADGIFKLGLTNLEPPQNATLQILLWKIEKNKGNKLLESCILWFHYKDSYGRAKWGLAHVQRYPIRKNTLPIWGPYLVLGAHQVPTEIFEHPPTNREVYEFLNATWWKFTPREAFYLIDSSVCINTWRRVIGEEPTKFLKEGT